MWEFANFDGGRSSEFPEPKITSQWDMSNNLKVNNQGILLRNLVIGCCSKVKLRSLGCKVTIKGRLVGGSSLWIFSRVDGEDGEIQAQRPICVIRKLVDSQRLFCIFGQKNPMINLGAFGDSVALNSLAKEIKSDSKIKKYEFKYKTANQQTVSIPSTAESAARS